MDNKTFKIHFPKDSENSWSDEEYKCAPNIYHEKLSKKEEIFWEKEKTFSTCFPKKYLIAMINVYNSQYSDKINLNKILKSEDNVKYKLWKVLQQKFYNKCENNEICWLEEPIIKKLSKEDRGVIYTSVFKPLQPKDKYGKYKGVWLSNFDIEKVMRQYELIYSDFKFLGPFPIDYIKYSFYNLDINIIKKLIKKGIKRIGIIFNTGTLKSGGQHWVALYLNFKNKDFKGSYTIEYFDSVGKNPPTEIKTFLEQVKDNICKDDCVPIHLHVKQLSHQLGNSECGVYCLYFITERLKGRTYIDIQSQLTPDDVMEKFRSKFYRKNKLGKK